MEDRIFSNKNSEVIRMIFDDILPNAAEEICIASSTLKDFLLFFSDNKHPCLFSQYLTELAGKGIEIRILTTPKMLNYGLVKRLPPNISVRGCARNHLKLICVDRRTAYFGTGNLTGSALGIVTPLRRNFEVGILTTNKTWVEYFHKLFCEIWNGHFCSNCKYLHRKLGCTMPGNRKYGVSCSAKRY